MTRNIWADPETFVKTPAMAGAVLRGLDLPRVDQYLDEIALRGSLDLTVLRKLCANTLLVMNGADHLATRRVIAPFFSKAGLSPWQPVIERACHKAADGLEKAKTPDLVQDFTIPLFMDVMPRILGLELSATPENFASVEVAQRLTEPYLSIPTLRLLNKAAATLITACPMAKASDAVEGPQTLLEFLRAHRAELPVGFDREHFAVGLLVGSNSATQSLAFALYGLLSGPVRFWREAAQASSDPQYIWTVLGHYQTTRTLVRVAADDTTITGCPYHKGQSAVVDIVAANSRMRKDLRQGHAHMSFGSGAHKCPGQFLSEMLFAHAIPYLARRFPDLTLKADECRFVVTPMMQAPVALPCQIDAVSRRVSARLCDVRDMDTARAVIGASGAFLAPPMETHLRNLAKASGRDWDTAIQVARNALFFMEGERHTALRDALTTVLGGARLSGWDFIVDTETAQCLAGLEGRDRVDLVSDFADPLRQRIMMRVLGISCSDEARFHVLAPALQDVLEPWLPLRELDRVQCIFAEALALMIDADQVERPLSVLGHLIKTPPEGFAVEDLKAVVLVLYGASFNLSHTLSNILHWMLTRPSEERSGFGASDWIEANLEDLIARHSSPKFIYRVAEEGARAGGLDWKAGDTARLNVHGLNRQVADGKGHLSFGQGLHRCIGAALSRMVIKAAVPALFRHVPQVMASAQEHRYFPMSQTVALSTLPCVLPSVEKS